MEANQYIITVVGLGAGDLDQLPYGIYRTLKQAAHLYLRTQEHPVVAELAAENISYSSFDAIYEQHESFEDVYTDIVEKLFVSAEQQGAIVYAVPGHPLVAERTVQLLLEQGPDRGVRIEIGGGQSFIDPLFARLKIDPIEGFSLLDGTALKADQVSPGLHTIIAQVYDAFVASDVKLTLMEVLPDDFLVTVATAVGVAGQECVETVPLYELDRLDHFGNLSLVYVPPARDERISYRQFSYLKDIVAVLRSPEGCPWDREQTHQSIRKNLIEETYEVLETIDDEDPDAMCEELGDLLMQIMLHSQMASEDGYFTVDDVVATLNEKLIRRHPHVFGEKNANDSEEALANWQEIKAQEKAAKGIDTTVQSQLAGIPRDLPALMYAYKLQKKAAQVGFDWDDVADVYGKVEEEYRELREAAVEERAGELGDLLFAVVNLARFLKLDPEEALALTNNKFKQRFSYIEDKLREAGKSFEDTDLKEMDQWWEEAKQHGKRRG
ncbi:nucleoside triphosphate pyrophosphohydrolase [Brevibacillus choshinensis]|uniref:Nucleoside triphosphate pyrophosphohydrolase n=1 Tax=Brevibacillus choshinensis TaxID=54911 RepID=A0ABX7FNI2_BRECH|nr:nucleoside triphosphate pyrophosphohydrolase [Brevibacillus choshinensis]QRG67803.1 nucleoside triphosphate pyrophosphohydrolase [Brevibacillus choshinensis]